MNSIAKNAPNNKKAIIDYLYNISNVVAASSAAAFDIIAEKESVRYGRAYFSDGKYEWTSEEVMYFDLYNLKLNDDFLRYVYEKIKE